MRVGSRVAGFLAASLLSLLSSVGAQADGAYFTAPQFIGPCTGYNIDGVCAGALSATVGLPFKAYLSANCGVGDDYHQHWSATVSVATGKLPPGLTMDDAGNITGVPEKAGDWNFSVALTDVVCMGQSFPDVPLNVRFIITGSS